MRKKAILLLAASVVMAVGVTAGTFALFTASTPAADNIFTAGTLAIDSYRDNGDTIPGPMFYTTPAEGMTSGGIDGLYPTGEWAPGDTNTRVLIIENVGSLDAKLISVGADAHAGSSMYLADKLNYQVATDAAFSDVVAAGTLGSLIATDVNFTHPINSIVGTPTEIQKLYFKVSLPLDADNSYQNLDLVVNFHVNAVQLAHNP